jgi:hypothetical protein
MNMKLLFENWRKFALLTEGGEAFKDEEGNPETVSIQRAAVQPTLDDFLERHLKPAGVSEYQPIGSTGKKSLSGDLDIVVSSGDFEPKEFKNKLLSDLKDTIGDEEVKLLGQNIAVRYPIMGNDEHVQIDLMLSPNIRHTGWLMSGTGDEEVKGTFRNYLLNFVASLRRTPHSRITISYPGGFQRKELPQQFDPNDPKSKRKWQNVGEKVSDPEELLKALGINANPEEVNNFVDLVQHLLTIPEIAPRLKEFPEYIKNIPYNEEEKQKAINYLLSVI